MLFSRKKEGVHAPQELLSEQTVHTHFAEAYRTLRTNIHLASVDQNVRSILVTSAGPGEGKTSVSANLGWTLARQGKSVVIIDCDLRRPCLSKAVDSSSSIGMIGLTADILGTSIEENTLNKDCTLADLLTLIDLHKKTGKLLVRDTTDAIELFFLNGNIADLAWLTCPQHLDPPLLLHREGFLNKEQLALAIEQQEDIGRQLGGMISSMSFADREKLKGVLTFHAAEAMQRLITMSAPTFEFTELSARHLSTDAADLADLPQQVARAIFRQNELPYLDSCIRQAVVQVEEHLAVLPAGPIPPNPSEMTASLRLHFVLSRLKHLYDFLIIDTPPVLPVSDALLLAPHVDGVILTVKTGYMHRNMISKAIEQLRDAKANLLGLVLNQVDSKREGYYRSYHKYASSYYGEQGR